MTIYAFADFRSGHWNGKKNYMQFFMNLDNLYTVEHCFTVTFIIQSPCNYGHPRGIDSPKLVPYKVQEINSSNEVTWLKRAPDKTGHLPSPKGGIGGIPCVVKGHADSLETATKRRLIDLNATGRHMWSENS